MQEERSYTIRILIIMGALLLVGMFCVMMVPMKVKAVEITGPCGADGSENSVTWSYDDYADGKDNTGTLTISGSGAMADYNSTSERPWNSYGISNIEIDPQITRIGNRAFASTLITEFESATDNLEIGVEAFDSCTCLRQVILSGNGTRIEESSFSGCPEGSILSITGNGTSIATKAFTSNGFGYFNNVTIGGIGTTIADSVFDATILNLTLEEGITSIGDNMVYFLGDVKTDQNKPLVIPSTVQTVGSKAFGDISPTYGMTGAIPTVLVLSPNTHFAENAFLNKDLSINAACTLIYPEGSDAANALGGKDIDRVIYSIADGQVSVVAINGTLGTTDNITVPETLRTTVGGSTVPVTAVYTKAGSNFTVNGATDAAKLTYEENGNTITITEITKGSGSTIVVPALIGGKMVAGITAEVPEGVSLTHAHYYVNGYCVICGAKEPVQEGQTPAKPIMEVVSGPAGNVYKIEITTQGELCKAAFLQAMPQGFTEALSFNLQSGDTTNYDTKTGEFTCTIPECYQKSGRSFLLIGIDKDGKTHFFKDMDTVDKTFKALLDLDGYAFQLIYTDDADAAKKVNTAAQAGDTYKVEKGDILSIVARKLKKTLDYLVDMNNLSDPNKIKIGQEIKY